jgi:ferredoxin
VNKKNDNLKEKEIKVERGVNEDELEKISGGGIVLPWDGEFGVDEALCNQNASCGQPCVNACYKKHAITMSASKKGGVSVLVATIDTHKCSRCFGDWSIIACEKACPAKAIKWRHY